MIGFGQTDDVLKLQNEVNDINYKMEKHHKQFYTGVRLNITGLVVIPVGLLMHMNPIIYCGGALILAGNIVILDSHKWFKNIDITADRIKKRTKQLDEMLRYGEINQEEYNNAISDLSKENKTID